jgi:hypothetical protein
MAAALSIQDPRIRPPDKEHKADEVHRQFVDKKSDFITLLNIWNAFFATSSKVSALEIAAFCASARHFSLLAADARVAGCPRADQPNCFGKEQRVPRNKNPPALTPSTSP